MKMERRAFIPRHFSLFFFYPAAEMALKIRASPHLTQ